MSPAHVLEPTYRTIKAQLMEGALRPGARIETNRLADELCVSATPVRDSLNRLAGEAMVDFHPGEGFYVPHHSEQDLRDMLEFAVDILLACVERTGTGAACPRGKEKDPALRASRLFDAIAAGSGNRETMRVIASLNDRLHVFRRLESIIMPDWAQELDRLERAARTSHAVAGLLRDYCRRRSGAAAEFVRLHEAGPH